jgi:hypothetical protein
LASTARPGGCPSTSWRSAPTAPTPPARSPTSSACRPTSRHPLAQGAALRAALTRIGGLLAPPEPPDAAPDRLRAPAGAPVPARALIGRGAHCDIPLRDPTVSRRHAELRLEPEGWVLEDLASLNGVEVNGRRVTRAVLHEGDEVRLGESRMRFEPDPEA